jgi:carboxyl-terminal processing protease
MPEIENSKNGKLNIWLPFLFAVVLAGGMYVGSQFNPAPQLIIQTDGIDPVAFSKIGNGRIEDLLRFIEARYVDEVNSDELIEKAIDKIISELDPHSSYIPVSQVERINDELEGNFDGVGIEFIILDDTIVVVTPISGGPSEEAGILAGDKIVEINDSTAVGGETDVRELVNKLRGQAGSKVKVGVKRGKNKTVKSFNIKREPIPIFSVDVGYMLDERTGFIKVNRFSATTYREFMEEVEELKEQGMEDLVVDLRQNPGGYLREATKMLSQLFPEKGKLLVYTEGRTVRRNEYKSTGLTHFAIGKIAILIDEGSASASEIVAGAVQDWDRGVIIGRRSFGKGLVQEQLDLNDGSALRLTVARYFTPSDRLIQKSYDDKNAYSSDIINRYQGGELLNKDSIHQSDTTQFFTKLEKRVVFGGGGITPDVFIPLDTTFLNDSYISLRQVLPQFIYRYAEDHANELREMSLEKLRDDFLVDDNMLNDFLKFGEENGAKVDQEDFGKIKENVKLLLKARLARNLYKEDGFYTIWNDQDEVVKAAMSALKKENPLADYDE